jgi:hypothetical protein
MRLKTNLVISGVFLVLLAFVYFLDKGEKEQKAEEERSKKLADFKDHEARSISIVGADTTIVLEKLEDSWGLVQPVVSGADDSAVNRLLSNLRETDVQRVIEDSAAVAAAPDLAAKYGLAEPRLRVLLSLSEGPLDTVAFGGDSPTGRYTYAQRLGVNPEIFTVEVWRLDNLDKSVFDLRDRRVLAFDRNEVGEVRITRPGGDNIVLSKEGSEGEWRFNSPLSVAADGSAVTGVLTRLQDGKARSFVAENPGQAELSEYGLSSPSPSSSTGTMLVVSLLLGEDRAEKRLMVGVEADGGKYYARDASRNPVFLIDSTLVNELRKPISELRDKRPLRISERDAVRRIEIRKEGEQLAVVERDSTESWNLLSPAGRTAKSWRWNSVITDLDGVEVTGFVLDWQDDDDPDLTEYGLEDPSGVVVVTDKDGAKVEVHVGGPTESGGVYIRRVGIPSVYEVEAETIENLDLSLDDITTPAADDPDSTSTGGEDDDTG